MKERFNVYTFLAAICVSIAVFSVFTPTYAALSLIVGILVLALPVEKSVLCKALAILGVLISLGVLVYLAILIIALG